MTWDSPWLGKVLRQMVERCWIGKLAWCVWSTLHVSMAMGIYNGQLLGKRSSLLAGLSPFFYACITLFLYNLRAHPISALVVRPRNSNLRYMHGRAWYVSVAGCRM